MKIIFNLGKRSLEQAKEQFTRVSDLIGNDEGWSKIHYIADTITSNTIKQYMASMSIYYHSLAIDITEQRRADSFTSLLCDLGGNLGLFIGASCLTIYELLDILVSHFAKW